MRVAELCLLHVKPGPSLLIHMCADRRVQHKTYNFFGGYMHIQYAYALQRVHSLGPKYPPPVVRTTSSPPMQFFFVF